MTAHYFDGVFTGLFAPVSDRSQVGAAPQPSRQPRGEEERPDVSAEGRSSLRRFSFGFPNARKEEAFIALLSERLAGRPEFEARIDVHDLKRNVFFAVLPKRAVDLYREQEFFTRCTGCLLPSGHLKACSEATRRAVVR